VIPDQPSTAAWILSFAPETAIDASSLGDHPFDVNRLMAVTQLTEVIELARPRAIRPVAAGKAVFEDVAKEAAESV